MVVNSQLRSGVFYLSVTLLLGLITLSSCAVPADQIIGEWKQTNEHYIGSSKCGVYCRPDEYYRFTWVVKYQNDLKLVNWRCECRDIGKGHSCFYDEDVDIVDDKTHHEATVIWKHLKTAVAIRLVADEVR
jgi:hypothetical protein